MWMLNVWMHVYCILLEYLWLWAMIISVWEKQSHKDFEFTMCICEFVDLISNVYCFLNRNCIQNIMYLVDKL